MSDRLAELRAAFGELLGAERRLRGRDSVRRGELSTGQVRALFQLAHGEECTAGELAKRAELSPASMTAMLDQLEADGIVERHRSATDRRQVIVSLTDAGHQELAARRAEWERIWAEALAGYSEQEVEAAASIMRSVVKLLDGIGKVGPAPAEDGSPHAGASPDQRST
jgi:DNA-binding MarR family transcriptional regulator